MLVLEAPALQAKAVELACRHTLGHTYAVAPRQRGILERRGGRPLPLRRVQPPRHDADDGPVLARLELAVGDQVGSSKAVANNNSASSVRSTNTKTTVRLQGSESRVAGSRRPRPGGSRRGAARASRRTSNKASKDSGCRRGANPAVVSGINRFQALAVLRGAKLCGTDVFRRLLGVQPLGDCASHRQIIQVLRAVDGVDL